jgi:hypothetical protein
LGALGHNQPLLPSVRPNSRRDGLPDAPITVVTGNSEVAVLFTNAQQAEGIDEKPGSLETLLEWNERDEAKGLEDAPWPVHHPKMPGEPTRVAPSRARKDPRRDGTDRSEVEARWDNPHRRLAPHVGGNLIHCPLDFAQAGNIGFGIGYRGDAMLVDQERRESSRRTIVGARWESVRAPPKIRDLLLDPASDAMDDRTEALLYAAARAQHIREVITPALEKGAVVLCDRFVDSSVVYQGAARGLGVPEVEALNRWATGDVTPDLVVLLDVDPEVGLARAGDQRLSDV